MGDPLMDVQRAVLFKLGKSDPVTVTEIHQWWFKHLTRRRVRSAVDALITAGLVRAAWRRGPQHANLRGLVVTARGSVPGELPAESEVFVNDYQVTRFPRDHGGARHFSLWVQYRGAGMWAVTRYRDMSPYMTYDRDGVEDYDGGPFDPDADDEAHEKNRAWRELRRWDSAEAAIEFAKTLLPGLTCNGRTAEDVMRRDPAGDRT